MIDFASASISLGMIAPELALLATAFVILLLCFARSAVRLAPWLTLVGLGVSTVYAAGQWGHQVSGFFGMVTSDNFGTAFKLIFLLVALITLAVSHRYLSVKGIARPEFYALLLISIMGMMIMANTSDLVVMFLGLEIMSVPLYVMAGFARRSLESNEAALKYFLMGAFASSFLLLGIAFLFGASGTTDLRRLAADFSYLAGGHRLYLYSGAALVLVGFGFKVAAVPFHTWVPDVYQGAPTPVTAFFSAGPKAAGFAALLRVFLFGLEPMAVLTITFWILAVLTMTVGNFLALLQTNVKRLLAYSSIAHAGYVMIALVVGGSQAVSAAVFYLLAYALFNLGAFAVIILLETRSGCHSEMSELTGLAKAQPYLAALLALFMFALSGFPPTVGFFAKFYLFSAAVKSGFYWLTVIAVVNSFLSVYYYLRVVKVAYLDEAETVFVRPGYSTGMVLALLVTAVGTLGLGLWPGSILHLSQQALFAFL